MCDKWIGIQIVHYCMIKEHFMDIELVGLNRKK